MAVKSERVLVIDDNRSERARLVRMLQDEKLDGGYVTDTVSCFERDTVGKKINEFNPDIILLDIMEGESVDKGGKPAGVDLVKYIRDTCRQDDTPILLVTKADRDPFRYAVKGIQDGAQNVILKDVDFDTKSVNQRVQMYLDMRSAARKEKADGEKRQRRFTVVISVICAVVEAVLSALLGIALGSMGTASLLAFAITATAIGIFAACSAALNR